MLEYFYEALASDHGIAIETNDPERLRQRLYSARRGANDPSLEAISIHISPLQPATQVWLVKKHG